MTQLPPKPKLCCKECKRPLHASELEDFFSQQELRTLHFEGDPPISYVIGHWPKDLFVHYHGFTLEEVTYGWAGQINGEIFCDIYYHDQPFLPPAVGTIPITYVSLENKPEEDHAEEPEPQPA